MYRSPTKKKQGIIESTARLCNVIVEAVDRNSTHLIICGDFNYPSIDWEYEFVQEVLIGSMSSFKNDIIKPFISTIQYCYLHQHVFELTHFSEGNKQSLLDIIISDEEGMIHQLTQNPGLGDIGHTCINFVLNCYAEVSNTTTRPIYLKLTIKQSEKGSSK